MHDVAFVAVVDTGEELVSNTFDFGFEHTASVNDVMKIEINKGHLEVDVALIGAHVNTSEGDNVVAVVFIENGEDGHFTADFAGVGAGTLGDGGILGDAFDGIDVALGIDGLEDDTE